MITLTKSPSFAWIDIENPTREDIASLVADFDIHPGFASELELPSPRAKTDQSENAFFAALHYPDHPSMRRDAHDIEVDYIVSKNLLVTAHYEPIDVFIDVRKEFEAEITLGHASAETPASLFLKLNNELYKGLREELEPFRKDIKTVEGEIFNGREFHMVEEISHIARRLLDFKQSIRPHKIILTSFEMNAPKLFPEANITRDAVMREYFRVESALENCREILSELRGTNDSLLTAKNNDVTKKLTLMAFVTFPLTLVAQVLEFRAAPSIFQGAAGFWTIVSILAVLLVMMISYFVYKNWL